MDAIGNYWFFWALYLAAAVVFTALFWRLTRFQHGIWRSYSLRAVAIAVIFTPWYSNPQDSIMAPALMVATSRCYNYWWQCRFSQRRAACPGDSMRLAGGWNNGLSEKEKGKNNSNNNTLNDTSKVV